MCIRDRLCGVRLKALPLESANFCVQKFDKKLFILRLLRQQLQQFYIPCNKLGHLLSTQRLVRHQCKVVDMFTDKFTVFLSQGWNLLDNLVFAVEYQRYLTFWCKAFAQYLVHILNTARIFGQQDLSLIHISLNLRYMLP